jgi:glycine/D-amino acid oxidase-like deaminating enzyme
MLAAVPLSANSLACLRAAGHRSSFGKKHWEAMAYIDTYYGRTLSDETSYPELTGDLECDTCIVGGGLAGLTVALQLARAGVSVAVLEAERIGWGASGRNGGFVFPGYANDNDKIARMTGEATANELHRLSIEGMRFVRDTIRDLDIASAAPTNGIMSVLRYRTGEDLRAYADHMRETFGYPLEYMPRQDVQAVLKSERYFEALRDPEAFHMHPLNYLRALAAEITRLGGKIFEGSAASKTDFTRTEKTVQTRRGTVRSRRVVVTTGGYTTNLVPRLKRSFLPIGTYVLLSEEAPDLIRSAIGTTDAVLDNRRAGDYYRLVEGGSRLLWGGRITTRPASPAALSRELRREMVSTYPQLADLRVEIAWSGLMSYARHLMPQIGRLAPDVWYCTAFGGHGLNTTATGGKLIAEAILEGSQRYRLFDAFGLTWTGGLAGLTAAQLTYWKLRVQDWWQERTLV